MSYEDLPDDYEPRTPRDSLRRLRYTMWPERYTDENSDVSELLWQLTLEQRAARYWLATLCVLVTCVVPVIVIITRLLT